MIGRRPPLLLGLLATTLVGTLLAALGPFGTYFNGPLSSRLLYWLATGWLGLAIYGAVLLNSQPWLTGAFWPKWCIVMAGSLLASFPEAWLSRKLALALWPVLASHAPSLWQWYGQTALIGAVWTIGLSRLLLRDREGHPAPDTPAKASAVQPVDGMALFSGDVVALQMEDHYIRVHRHEGSQMVLMPLSQGIAALDGIEGLRTHRSWWVARGGSG